MNNLRNYKQMFYNNISGKRLHIVILEFLKKPFIRNVFVVVSGTALAQVITTLFSPVLTRIYGPEMMGIFGTFSSVLSIAAPIAALTFPIAIVIAKEDKEAKELAYLSFAVSCVLSAAAFIVFLLFGRFITDFLQVSELRYYLLLVPAVMLFASVVEILSQWFIRKGKFSLTARAGVYFAVITNSLKLILGLAAPTAATLVIVTTVGTGIQGGVLILGTGILSYFSVKKINFADSKKKLSQIAKKYQEFPIYRAPQAFVNSISLNLPILMLTTLFGPAAAGFYALGNKVLLLPVSLIGDSVGNVFYPRFSQAYNEGENTSKLLVTATLALTGIGILPFGFLILLGPSLFGLVFGRDWVTAGIYARWIGLWVFTTFISRPAVKALPVVGAQKFHLIHTVASIGCKVGLLVVGALVFESDVIAIALYGTAGALLNILLIVVTIYRCKNSNQSV